MKNLFLIDGAAGTGKTDLINYISNFKTDTSYVKKFTTRIKRSYEERTKTPLDLIHITKADFEDKTFEYKYIYQGEAYGFTKSQIEDAFQKSDNVFIIVRNEDVIRKLKNDYNYINVVSIFIHTETDKIKERLQQDLLTPEEIEFRINRSGIAYKSYSKNPELYDNVLINSGSKEIYEKIIDVTYKKYQNMQSIEQNLIFVLMPFNPKSHYDKIYKEFVDAAKLVNKTLVVKRMDKQRGDYRITDEILNNISKARLIICDLTDERPNVYYELGYARGLKKTVITCAEENATLHFDIKDFHTILYKNSDLGELREEISSEIEEHLKSKLPSR